MNMTKLWQGRLSGELPIEVALLNNSIRFDQRLYPQDIQGSIAHARMLGKQGIIQPTEAEQIINTLQTIGVELSAGMLAIDAQAEDIHSFLEAELIRRIGEVGKKLHTGRSRNDQVALDLRLFLRDEVDQISAMLSALQTALREKSQQHLTTLMPGYTHLQRAQPVTFANHLMAYEAMVGRDIERLSDARKRINRSPLGAGALAGSSFPLDRQAVASELGFDCVLENTLDAVADRDVVIEVLSSLSILMMHLSRLCEELVLWSSQEFGFITINEAYTTGSSMMPQKKNPDVAELIRGKTGRVYGSLFTLLTIMKGLPLAYNKDMQEDKEALFDALDTVKLCLPPLSGMIATLEPNVKAMQDAVEKGFTNATALADYLVRKGVPFRDAYALVGQIVNHCIAHGETLEGLTMASYQGFSTVFDTDLYQAIRYQSQ
jgi:argininosuccinate lyase